MKRLVVVSDIHAGSYFGLWPEGFKMPGGGSYQLNQGQRYLLECWNEAIDKLPRCDGLLLNGDLRDGRNVAEKGFGQVTTDIGAQGEALLQLTERLRRKAKIVIATAGTRYHENTEEAQELARQLGAEQSSTGFYARPIARFDVGGVRIDARHKLSGALIYKATAMQRAMMFSQISAVRKGYDADMMVGSHWHQYASWEMEDYAVITTPAWELLNPYAELRQPDLWWPTLGLLLIEIDPVAKIEGRFQDIFKVRRFIYAHPKVDEDAIKL